MAAEFTSALLARNGVRPADVRLFVPHQASIVMIEGVMRRIAPGPLAADRVLVNLDRYGNTSGAGVALGLAEESVLAPGDLCCIAVFGGGYPPRGRSPAAGGTCAVDGGACRASS